VLAPRELDRLIVVLVSTRNPLNLGAAARAMSNFGFSHLRVVHPYEVAFREARSAVGAADVLAGAMQFDSLAESVEDCSLVVGTTAVSRRAVQHVLHPLEQGGPLIAQRLRSEKVALLFGSEKTGLTNEELSHCHWLMRVPTREKHSSMNLGQAVAVSLYELVRNAAMARDSKVQPLAPSGTVHRITRVLISVLSASGYLKSQASPSVQAKIRRQVLRLNLSSPDAELWLGMLRQIAWKVGITEDQRDKKHRL